MIVESADPVRMCGDEDCVPGTKAKQVTALECESSDVTWLLGE